MSGKTKIVKKSRIKIYFANKDDDYEEIWLSPPIGYHFDAVQMAPGVAQLRVIRDDYKE